MPRILIVDDDSNIRRGLTSFLAMLGHEVHAAENGKKALEVAGDVEVDLIISDINMPEMDGIELLMTIRGSHPNLPVLVMSGGGLMDKKLLLANAEALGAHRTIEKPFDLDDMEAAVEELLS